jgi:MinD superfamily P-loop ATPase
VRQIVILSGKGGTGKTTVTAALAHLASQEASIVLADTDVDAANLELVLSPRSETFGDQTQEGGEFAGGGVAVIDAELCTACDICAEVCRFEAIVPGDETYTVDEIGCEGCAACFYQCPVEAIEMQERMDGRWFRSQARYGPLFHAHLFAARENSGKLVTLVKGRARLLATEESADYLLVDGPPGIGCPVIAAISGADLTLLVTEPTVAGAHDLERVVGMARHFGIQAVVCINKYDLNPAKTEEIASWCAERGVPVVGRIPFDQAVTRAMVQGKPITEHSDGPVAEELRRIWARLKAGFGENELEGGESDASF